MKRNSIWIVGFTIVFLTILGYNNCSSNDQGGTNGDTVVGNPLPSVPGNPPSGPVAVNVAQGLSTQLCILIVNCDLGANAKTCTTEISSLNGFGAELGLSQSAYSSLSSISTAEASGEIVPNVVNYNQCMADLQGLSCNISQVKNAYDASLANPFSNAIGILPITPSGACAHVF